MRRPRGGPGPSRPLRTLLARALVTALVVQTGLVLGVAAAAVLAGTGRGGLGVDGRPRAGDVSERSAPATPVAELVDAHSCWVGAAPAAHEGDVPGHVVVTLDGRLRYSSTLVEDALDHVFVRSRDDMVVHAFCP